MKYDTAGNEVFEYSKCPVNCQSTAGCSVCRPTSMKTIQERIAEFKKESRKKFGRFYFHDGAYHGFKNHNDIIVDCTGTVNTVGSDDVENFWIEKFTSTLTDIEAECAKEKKIAYQKGRESMQSEIDFLRKEAYGS